jgi:deoxyribonuclease-4
MRLGCHLSIAKGYAAAVKAAPPLGANAFQYFTKNPRGFRNAKPLDRVDAERGRELMRELDLVAVGHTPYLINLATPEDELFHVSVDALVQDLVIAEARGSYGVVVHCGKPKDQGRDYGIERMQKAISIVLERNETEGVAILIENTAGQGSEIGTALDELLTIVAPFSASEVGICLDTQHAFAAGMLSRENPGAFPGFDNPDFMSRLKAIHLNDSKVEFGAHRDRHELIGQGYLGSEGIAGIVNDPRLKDIPFYLETPVESESQYADEIRAVKALIEPSH